MPKTRSVFGSWWKDAADVPVRPMEEALDGALSQASHI